MTVKDMIEKTGWQLLCGSDGEAVTSGYVCDLLSWAMAHVQTGTAWITVQAHINTLAVASLTGCACVIIPENITVSDEVLAAAKSKGVTLVGAPCSAYGAACMLSGLGIGEAV